ncbi:hypothetical protein [Phytomonospora endophytica]|uniref:Threonine dehydrogenase-like Zn-dependent dehydrogenase n=1 Tax=Phytomonospora endophytica TaxID=714109 RepID=A0A841FJ28_9ACTN|nr:hypothetical protein [Phytomonospora endophytica]MBB6036206.1 threonine dehydrogenase-like Zn-dependent dehydrogenase [Phytomonospora endophytica]GIG67112.1 hypothetical protein Pen01_34070 [Phytomonospora endophytica]
MAWYTIEHACGHVVERRLNGTKVLGEREAAAERLAEGPCRDCRRRERDAAAVEAMAAAEDAGDWPVLTGGERQVESARRIRHEAAEQVRSWEHGVDPERAEVVVPLLLRAVARRDAAAWWNDRRGTDWTRTLRAELTAAELERVEGWTRET